MRSVSLFMIICLFAISFAGKGQDNNLPKPDPTYEIGFDATGLLHQIINLGNQQAPESLYKITFKRHRGTWSFRSGIGFAVDNQTVSLDTINEPREENFYSMNFSIGTERKLISGERFGAYIGLDAFASDEFRKTISETRFDNFNGGNMITIITRDVISTRSTSFGLSPLLGLEFKFSDRIKLFTETHINYAKGKSFNGFDTTSRQDNQGVVTVTNNFTQTQNSKTSNLSVALPTSIFLAITF